MIVATKVNDKYEYFFVSIRELKRFGISDREYKMGDKVKVTIGTVENQEVGVSVK